MVKPESVMRTRRQQPGGEKQEGGIRQQSNTLFRHVDKQQKGSLALQHTSIAIGGDCIGGQVGNGPEGRKQEISAGDE